VHRLVLIGVLAIGSAQAADAPAASAGLRTLFHSAPEREKLDRMRRGEPTDEAAGDPVKRAPPRVTGFVKRSDGRDTVWLDGRPVTGADAKRHADSAKGREGEGNPRIEIKPSR